MSKEPFTVMAAAQSLASTIRATEEPGLIQVFTHLLVTRSEDNTKLQNTLALLEPAVLEVWPMLVDRLPLQVTDPARAMDQLFKKGARRVVQIVHELATARHPLSPKKSTGDEDRFEEVNSLVAIVAMVDLQTRQVNLGITTSALLPDLPGRSWRTNESTQAKEAILL